MPSNARNYREHLYKNRSHPHVPASTPSQDNNSLWIAQVSFVPFLVLEYFAEKRIEALPSGIVFPVAYLIFWAFFYTYVRPGYLETKLSGSKKWDTVGIPSVLFGVAIWVVKVLVVELTDTIISRGLLGLGKKSQPKPHRTAKAHAQQKNQHTSHAHAKQTHHAKTHASESHLPSDITAALGILGIPNCRDWATIHRRYRELAKLTHPDLNRDTTQIGRRFMIVDAAYRKLLTGREKYFQ